MPGYYKIITFGCQMNKSDSERFQTVFDGIGMTAVEGDEQADVILLNTCSVRQMAEDRVYGQVHNLKKIKEQKPELIIAVTGCMAGRDKDGAIRARLREVDLFFPTSEMVLLPKRIAELRPDLIDSPHLTAESEYEHYLKIKPSYTASSQAFISISTGCNKFCTYCVVPFARGLQKDRPAGDVLTEIRERALQGCIEVTLLGQTVNWYRVSDFENFSTVNPFVIQDPKANNFAALLWEVNHISGIERIHFTAAHPNYMTDEVIEVMALSRHVNYLHLPVQAGNNEVLKRMNRPYTREQYLETIKRLRTRIPNIALGTDIIVGFCGETPEQFDETVSLYRECDFDISYTAMYSVRSGTMAAARYPDDVSKPEKKRRWLVLQSLMEETALRKNQAFVGKALPVLVDHFEKGICSGNSGEMKRVQFRGEESLVGKIVPVIIDRAVEWMLYGSVSS